MDPERERIQDDLRGVIDGEVRCDDLFVQMYASDASIYEIKPLGVVRPRSLSDVVACVKYAAENQLPLHPRGAGTGLAGESLGRGLVMDFSCYMRRVVKVDEETVRVQPGIVLAELNRHLEPYGRMFGPDPATRSVTTMGSVLALDASGSHWLQCGSARGNVVSMQVVLADGEVIEANTHVVPPALSANETRTQGLTRRLADVVSRNQQLIVDKQPKSLVNRCGYHLFDVLDDGRLDLAKMLVGSEGTLAITTEATVRTVRTLKHRGVALLFFDRLENAARGALALSNMGVSACDMMDRRLLSIAREMDVRFELIIPAAAEAMLLVEQQSDSANELRERLNQVVVRLQRRKRLAFDARTTLEKDERDLYWRLTRRVIPTLYRFKGNDRAIPIIEDVAVPPETLPDFLTTLQNIFKSHQITASVFSHAGHGQLHIRPFMDISNKTEMHKLHSLADAVYDEVLRLGGTISGEHGAGLSRTAFVRKQYGPLYDVFREVKRIFDPQNLFNPDKVVSNSTVPVDANLRPVSSQVAVTTNVDPPLPAAPASGESPPVVQLQVHWNENEFAFATRSCNGCGRCRSQSPSERMCPVFRLGTVEESSPRAKANLMRAVLTGSIDPHMLETEQLKGIADLCVNCHQCRLECPANVDIPKLMLEAKSQYVATNGLRPQQWLLGRIDLLSALGSRFSRAGNWALSNRQTRWLLEKLTGIAQGRKLPPFAAGNFLRVAHRRRLTRPSRAPGNKVALFLDVYANYNDTMLAEAVVAVLQHNGVSVYVPPDQVQSGMALLSMGAADRARKLAQRNVATLAEAVRQGYHVVTTEPSAALCLTHEYQNLLDDEDVQLVARNSSEICNYLLRLHQSGRLELDLRPINTTLGYHQPCHVRAINQGRAAENLLRLIPGLKVKSLQKGCSGMAGSWGIAKKNYRNSLRAGWGLISALREPDIQIGTTECTSCKMQMEQGTTKPTVHPIKLLALSYGLVPEFESLLSKRGQELITT